MVFLPGCPDAKEHKLQLVYPVQALELSLEGAFQLVVEMLNNAFGLWVVGGFVGG